MFYGRLRRNEDKMKIENKIHRFKTITLQEPPKDIELWYKTAQYSDDRITVFRLHDMISINQIDQKAFYKDLRNHLTQTEINESKKLRSNIKSENDISKLISLYDDNEHKELSLEIILKMISIDKHVYKRYIDQLKTRYTENQFDNIIHILVETIRIIDISEDIIEVLQNNYVRDPQDFAVLVQILGLSNKDLLSFLYTFYRYFINNFPNNNYFEGPLLGISYYIEKRRRTTAST